MQPASPRVPISPLRLFITSVTIILIFEAIVIVACDAVARFEPPQFMTQLFIAHLIIGELAISAVFLKRYGFNLAIPARGLKFTITLIVTLGVVFGTLYTSITSYPHMLFSLVKAMGVSTTATVENVHYYYITRTATIGAHGPSTKVEEVNTIADASRITMTLHYNGLTSQVGLGLNDSDLQAVDFIALDEQIQTSHTLPIRYCPFLPWITAPETAFTATTN